MGGEKERETERRVKVLMDWAVTEGIFPGGVALWGSRTHLRGEVAAGRLWTVPPPLGPLLSTETMFDLASLTKPLVTGALALLSVMKGGLDLSSTVQEVLVESRGSWVGGATVREILTHSAGLCAWAPLYEGMETGWPLAERKRVLLERIVALPPVSARREKSIYSDFGFILLGWMLEQIWGKPLDALYREWIALPLEIESADFLVPASPLMEEVHSGRLKVAATEIDPDTGRPFVGVVHDEHARILSGVSGHAGLFGSARAVWSLARPWVGGRFFSSDWLELFRLRQDHLEWTLGWDTPTSGSSSGRFMTPGGSIGHLGYAGTSVWIDWKRDRIVVLLTNRVHPVRTNNRIREFRPLLHDAILEHWAERGSV